MSPVNELILIGGGGHCRSCIDVIEAGGNWKITGILDVAAQVGQRVFDYEIIGTDAEIETLAKRGAAFLVSVGQIKSPDLRIALYEKVSLVGGQLPVLISPRAYVSPRAELGAGTIVMHGAVVNCGAKIGANVIVNSMALIEHEASVGDHCHISTGARINGDAIVGAGCFIGSNAVLHHGARVAEAQIVAAGAVYRAHAKQG